MQLRPTRKEDLDQVMGIISQAMTYMKTAGIDQWQNGYPDRPTIEGDIATGIGYVAEDEDGSVVATVAVTFDGELSYRQIEDGAWLTDGAAYATVHRIAVRANCKGRGVSSYILAQVEAMCRQRQVGSIRVDTHRDNRSMQRLLQKNGFSRCGRIFLCGGAEDGHERIAFEKVL
ncbi:GNAT family N-acetyltransferase [Neobittarella massiliensis]|uniref:GNAT family N-acetyltransferase n=1 Tax=Neobittarella massiliensis (ex Bilen et al. 2018) TaxID=2041842 RepID=A0A8J6IQN3_9FIRM|nr:GNAT family N-acetyltransferase [Neobittarella massiliensis]MBC3516353.1 GNAT family N-acetyltransferase [Neobittarella massiliensis]